MINPLNNLGTIRKFNCVNINQTQPFNHVHCETYINKIVQHHNWQNERIRVIPVPMRTDVKYQTKIQLNEGPESVKEQKQLEKQMGFSYQQCIGELIYALTICRVDISIAVITLSQHSINPAQIHYETVKHMFLDLNATQTIGLTYWRTQQQMDLPYAPDPITISDDITLRKFNQQHNALEIVGACDATWASDRLHRRSMGEIVMMLAGAATYYRTRLQPTVTQSSTEAEFTNMADAGKVALYLRWILEELGIIMDSPTPIHADNQGAIRMANAQQPTRRTRHAEMKHFVILQWTDDKFINFIDTKTDENYSDSLSKPTSKTKFYEHTDIFMRQRRPSYTTEPSLNPHSQKGKVYYLSLSTYRTNPIVSLLQYDSLQCLDSASAA